MGHSSLPLHEWAEKTILLPRRVSISDFSQSGQGTRLIMDALIHVAGVKK